MLYNFAKYKKQELLQKDSQLAIKYEQEAKAHSRRLNQDKPYKYDHRHLKIWLI